jgi:predicted amidohydrolase YtcJ
MNSRPLTRIVVTAAAGLIAASASAQPRPVSCDELVLYNGKIVTMDARRSIASSATLRHDRIAAVGTGRGIPQHNACARLIDLGGRTVVPGLIDSHNHIVQNSLRPGHDLTAIDVAFSLAELQAAIRAKTAALAPGEWITAVGRWAPTQFTEKRMPTLAELDAAAPNHPVYLQTGFNGPSVTNTKGKAFLESKGMTIGADGAIGANAPTVAASNALRSLQTAADRVRGASDVMAYVAGLGLTMSDDKGGAWPADTPGAQGLAALGNGAANEVPPFTGYDQFRTLDREGRMPVRLRIFYYMQDIKPELPFLTARLNNMLPDFGNDRLKVSGMGERLAGAMVAPEVYETAARLTAQRGWAYDQHANGLEDQQQITSAWEKVNRVAPLAGLRWCLAHVPGTDLALINRLKAMDVGVSITGGRYPAGAAAQRGSPFRLLLESGIHVGYGSDGGSVSPLNPWVHIYYLVTGKNSGGEVIEPADQRLTRLEALQVYTVNQGWFTKDENALGSIEVGKLADVVVLSADLLDPQKVPDDAIRHITSVLTIVGGRPVHAVRPFSLN